ncbi:MAG: ATP-binding protein [Planctomycetes bacterium]|nr:ATP-binding protein [Planctomycetota bacterium]
MLVAATAALTFHLVDSALEERLRLEIAQAARLLGHPGFPLGDESLRRVAEFIGADVVVTDAAGRPVATSLAPERRRAFAPDALPPAGDRARVAEATLGAERFTVGVVALPPPRVGSVYVLYPVDLLASQRQRAWAPVTLVAALATLAAALLGRAGERRVVAARTQALLRLLVSVAHEVKNPLGAIKAIARAQAKRAREGTVEPAPLELIATESERLALLVDGLRSVGQPAVTARKPVDPDATTARTIALLEPLLGHRRVTVDADLRAGAATVLADASQVQQVVLNLLQNAADAMPRGGRVRLASRLEGGRWTLTVEDEGPGVPDAVRARLFQPFFTTKERGLGVGLALSRGLCRAHGGDLALVPPVGGAGGARFALWLPAERAAQPAAAEGA